MQPGKGRAGVSFETEPAAPARQQNQQQDLQQDPQQDPQQDLEQHQHSRGLVVVLVLHAIISALAFSAAAVLHLWPGNKLSYQVSLM